MAATVMYAYDVGFNHVKAIDENDTEVKEPNVTTARGDTAPVQYAELTLGKSTALYGTT